MAQVPAKVQLMEDVMLSNLARLEAEQKLAGEDAIEPPVTILWVPTPTPAVNFRKLTPC